MAITRVQGNALNSGAATSIDATLPSGVMLGNLVVAAVACGNNATGITPPDASWQQGPFNQPNGSSATIETSLWFLVVDAGHAGQTDFTWTFDASHTLFVAMSEWHATNGWPATPLDRSAVGDTASSPVQATSIKSGTTSATTQGEELWVSTLAYKGGAQTETGISANWNDDLEATRSGNNTMTMLYRIVSTTGAAACQYSIGSAQYWAGCIATFKSLAVSTSTRTVTPVTTALSALARTRPIGPPVTAALSGTRRSTPASAALSSLGRTRTAAAVRGAVYTPGLTRTVTPVSAALLSTTPRSIGATASFSGLPLLALATDGGVIRANDVNQVVIVLQRPTGMGAREAGKYALLGASSVTGGTVGAYVGTLSRGSTPGVGVALDVGDGAPTNCSSPTADSLTASGFRVSVTASRPTLALSVSGNYIVSF